MKLFELFKADDRLGDLFDRVRAELISSELDEVWSHTIRVIKNLFRIKELINFDLKKTVIAAIIHDVGYIEAVSGHERISSKMMKNAIDKLWDHVTVNEVCHIVEAHQFNGELKPETIEAMALHDADVMDYAGEKGTINLFKLLSSLGLRDSEIALWIHQLLTDGFLIAEIKKHYGKEISDTEKFFLNYVKELNKERADLSKYGMENV